MLSQLKPAILITIVMTVLTGLIYPLAITAIAQILFPHQANGSLIAQNGRVIGSHLIAQAFAKPEYFHPRLSAAGSNGYDATASGGSNLGATNPDLAKRIAKDAAAYRTENGVTGTIPADAVTASGSGLDPDISPANALLQAPRVARARQVVESDITALIGRHTQGRQLGFLGEPRVNVLELNMDLDSKYPLK